MAKQSNDRIPASWFMAGFSNPVRQAPIPPHISEVAAKDDAPYCATCNNTGTVTRDLTGCESPAARGKHWLQQEPCPECGGES